MLSTYLHYFFIVYVLYQKINFTKCKKQKNKKIVYNIDTDAQMI